MGRGRHRDLRIQPAAPLDVAALRASGASVEEIDGLTFGARIMQLRSLALARQMSSERLRSQAIENAVTFRANVDQLLDLRLEIAS